MHKTWNVRDQTEENLREEIERLYKEIEASYKLLKKIKKIEDAQKMVDRIWLMKKWVNDIQIELIRREYNETQKQAEAYER